VIVTVGCYTGPLDEMFDLAFSTSPSVVVMILNSSYLVGHLGKAPSSRNVDIRALWRRCTLVACVERRGIYRPVVYPGCGS
jgi:hypothetical protein